MIDLALPQEGEEKTGKPERAWTVIDCLLYIEN